MDANILLSVLNTKLRDKYDTLDDLFDNEDYDRDEVIDMLKQIGYEYDQSINQFKLK
jgi:hypothetical protein